MHFFIYHLFPFLSNLLLKKEGLKGRGLAVFALCRKKPVLFQHHIPGITY